MKRIILSLSKGAAKFLILFLVIAQIGCTASGETWERVQADGILRVGIDATYPPFASFDNNVPVGFDVELAQAIADDLGLELQFTYFGYDGLYDALQTELVDVLISGLVIQPERSRDFAYSDPYFNAGQYLIVPNGSDIASPEQLANRKVAVELGAEGHVLALEWSRKVAGVTVVTRNSPDEALGAVADESADVAIMDAISALLFLQSQPTLNLIQPALNDDPFAMAVRVDDEQFLEVLNESLARLGENGTLGTIEINTFAISNQN